MNMPEVRWRRVRGADGVYAARLRRVTWGEKRAGLVQVVAGDNDEQVDREIAAQESIEASFHGWLSGAGVAQ